ncbi:MAG: response regulator [Syntrophales bacterium]|jgi:putative two-component system response regulator|nr:response regulator [Syntrophales bacterium]MCK9391342.1 response regulator [Syntrophales bacterium]
MSSEKIMVVEDEWIVADQLCMSLKELGYTVCSTASTGYEAIMKVESDRPDLILMDIVLKGRMDGIEAAGRINSQFNIPVLYLTAHTNQKYIERAKQTNPFGYLVKPYNQKELYATIEMALHKHRADKEIVNSEMILYKHRVDKETKDHLDRLTRCYTGTIKTFSGAIELRGPYAAGHHQRVAEFAHAIAKEMGLPDFSVEGLWLSAQVYDISLVNMPMEIVRDSGKLTGVNLTMYRTYPQSSYDILKEVYFPWPVANIALQHRECWDGSGFPRGIKGEDILIEARILAIADALEDLTSHRAFRNAFPLKPALDEISTHRGSQYDPDVVDACLRLFNDEERL